MSNAFFAELQPLCAAEDWHAASELWQQADEMVQSHPMYVFSGMQIAAELWRPDIQAKACELSKQSNIPPAALLQIAQTVVHYYQYDCLRSLLDFALSTECYNQETILPLGVLASRFNAPEQATTCFEKAQALGLDASLVNYNKASIARFAGDKPRCESLLDECIRNNPQMVDAHYMRSNLKNWSEQNNHLDELESVIDDIREPIPKAQLYYALAKEYEDCENFDKAFSAMQLGAGIVKQQTNFDVESEIAFMQAIQQHYPLSKPTLAHNSENNPLFICGLPRTGSTLLERMLVQHSQIESAGELNQFADLFMRRASKQFHNQNLNQLQMVEASTQLDYASLGRDYAYSLDPQLTSKRYMIDKMPQNSLFVGPILSAIPQAKIILVDRDPMDACLAMYKQIFQGIYEFSYDLNDLGAYVKEMRQMMQHWQSSYPEQVHILSYEALVSETQTCIMNACDFLNIEYEPDMLTFQKDSRLSTTASADQVRQKVYTSSVGKWRRYGDHLESLKKYFPEFVD